MGPRMQQQADIQEQLDILALEEEIDAEKEADPVSSRELRLLRIDLPKAKHAAVQKLTNYIDEKKFDAEEMLAYVENEMYPVKTDMPDDVKIHLDAYRIH